MDANVGLGEALDLVLGAVFFLLPGARGCHGQGARAWSPRWEERRGTDTDAGTGEALKLIASHSSPRTWMASRSSSVADADAHVNMSSSLALFLLRRMQMPMSA